MGRCLKYCVLSFIGLLVVVILTVKFFPFGSKKYTILSNNTTFELPKLSFDIHTSENKILNFKTFRSKTIIEAELISLLNQYDKYRCNSKEYYYDKQNNLTIMNYKFVNSHYLNQVQIEYHNNMFTNNECGKVGDFKNLKYTVTPVNETGYCYIDNYFEYEDVNGNIYNIHYNCFGNLSFENGMGKMIYLNQILSYKWISIENIIDFMEFQVANGNASKATFDENGSLIYENNDFYLLKCNTMENNKDIYIGKKIDKEKKYCN